MKITSREILSLVLAGASDGDLEAAVRRAVTDQLAEDHLLDFKAGAWLSEPDYAEDVRRLACAFANADGGVLVVGVTEEETERAAKRGRKVKTSRAKGFAGTLPNGRDLVSTALHQVVALDARVRLVVVDCHTIVIVGVRRYPSVFTYYEGGKLRCYVRLGTTTPDVPESMRLDLGCAGRNLVRCLGERRDLGCLRLLLRRVGLAVATL